MSASALGKNSPSQAVVLSKAFLNATKQLGLTQAQAGSVIGMHRTAVSQLKLNPTLKPTNKSGELGLLVIRLARSLFALAGGDEKWIRHFMHSHNTTTNGVPCEQIKTIQGLIAVVQITDALRGKV